jgi:molybdopterin-guanine dinucleotide biosynthesis protein A
VAKSITGVVLCGGAGRRFGGDDKPLLDLGGRPLLAHVLDRLEAQVDQLMISANRNLDAYEGFGQRVVVDRFDDRGPLAGILAAAEIANTDLLFTCPGDSPLLPMDLVSRMAPLLTERVNVVIPNDGERTQHLFMLLRRQDALDIGGYLDSGARSVHGWVESLEHAELSVSEPDVFLNVNTPEDLSGLKTSRLAI